jgi:hypothetical protein
MVYRIGTRRRGDARELYLVPGVVLTVYDGGRRGRVRLRRALRPAEHGPDLSDGELECLVEWLADDGSRSGRLAYVALKALHPDLGPGLCPLPRRSSEAGGAPTKV